MANTIQPNPDQAAALEELLTFIAGNEQSFVLKGKAGTGKTTVIGLLEARLAEFKELKDKLGVSIGSYDYKFLYAAATNKAAEALSYATGQEAGTIHRIFNISMFTDFQANPPRQVSYIHKKKGPLPPHIVVVDEASYVDQHLLDLIMKQGKNCKLIFMGDPAQLPPVGSSETPVFVQGFPQYELKQVMRQKAGTLVSDLCANVRNAVENQTKLTPFTKGEDIVHLDQAGFNQAVYKEFGRDDWESGDSVILAYTNNVVNYYNNELMGLIKGRKDFKQGDYALVNRYVMSLCGKHSCKTESTVLLRQVRRHVKNYGPIRVDGFLINIAGASYFLPKDPKDRDRVMKYGQESMNLNITQEAMDCFIDLRPLYACTVNKSQGSTFDTVYIDLNDFEKVNSRDLRMRLLYVAVSRARNKIVFTGNLKL